MWCFSSGMSLLLSSWAVLLNRRQTLLRMRTETVCFWVLKLYLKCMLCQWSLRVPLLCCNSNPSDVCYKAVILHRSFAFQQALTLHFLLTTPWTSEGEKRGRHNWNNLPAALIVHKIHVSAKCLAENERYILFFFFFPLKWFFLFKWEDINREAVTI